MTTGFGILFTVSFRHSYFSSSKLECLTVSPGQESLHVIQNNGLLFKPFKDGFRILYETSIAGRPRTREDAMRENITLRFSMGLHDPYFYNYTSGSFEDIKGSAFYFRNFSATGAVQPAGVLHAEDTASEKDLFTLESLNEASFIKPFGLVDIRFSGSLEESYTIRFEGKSTYWRYLVISDHLKSLNSPAILGSGASFNGPDPIMLPDNRQALAFVSAGPIGLSESAKDTFQLVENYEPGSGKYKVVMRALPMPDAKAVSYMPGHDRKSLLQYSEIFI